MAFETIRSASGVDFFGTPESDTLVAFNELPNFAEGSIFANGRGGDDFITFNAPNTGITRNALIQGGQGIDTLISTDAISDSTWNGNLGNDFVTIRDNIANSFVSGGQGDDQVTARDGAGGSTISGGEGDDDLFLRGLFANSLINGNGGNDDIQINSNGDDEGLNFSTVSGGQGNDTITDNGNNSRKEISIINGNLGNDQINLTGGGVTNGLSVLGGQGADTLDADTAVFTNNDGDVVGIFLDGAIGNDSIFGSNGDDTINGGDGNDSILGNDGDDSMSGGAGDDVFEAGVPGSDDTINGGLGADEYRADAGGGEDDFIIGAIEDSAATTTGTVQGFDTFLVGSFQTAVDELDITGVSSALAGGRVNAVNAPIGDLGDIDPAGGFFTDFAALKVALDASAAVASTTAGLNVYRFVATVGNPLTNPGVVPNQAYLWINDNQKAYNAGDLMFAGAGTLAINATNILV